MGRSMKEQRDAKAEMIKAWKESGSRKKGGETEAEYRKRVQDDYQKKFRGD